MMVQNKTACHDQDVIKRDLYIEKLHRTAAEYAHLFMKHPGLRSNQVLSSEYQNIASLIREVRFSREIPDERELNLGILKAEAEVADAGASYV